MDRNIIFVGPVFKDPRGKATHGGAEHEHVFVTKHMSDTGEYIVHNRYDSEAEATDAHAIAVKHWELKS